MTKLMGEMREIDAMNRIFIARDDLRRSGSTSEGGSSTKHIIRIEFLREEDLDTIVVFYLATKAAGLTRGDDLQASAGDCFERAYFEHHIGFSPLGLRTR